jgi:hypothetical protein
VLEPQVITHDQLGRTLQRTGSQAEMNAPRGLYLGEHTGEVLGSIDLSPAAVEELRSRRIV